MSAIRSLKLLAGDDLAKLAGRLAGHPLMAKAVKELDGSYVPNGKESVVALVIAEALNEMNLPGAVEQAGAR